MPNRKNDTIIDTLTQSHSTNIGKPKPTLTVLTGSEIGRVFLLEQGASTVGRSAEVAVHIPHESISRRHCEVIVQSNGQAVVRDLGSTNGTRVNEIDVSGNHIMLKGGERLRLSKKVVLKFAYQDRLERNAREDLYSNAVRDPLTGSYNKRFFMERTEHEVAYAARHGSPLTLIIFDLDHFKQVNDTHGHPTGDAVLIETATRVHNSLRSEDILARYGGEEFVVLMRNTPIAEAVRVAERIREAVSTEPVVHLNAKVRITVSIGISEFDANLSPNADALIAQADAHLYKAKTLGRDRVISE